MQKYRRGDQLCCRVPVVRGRRIESSRVVHVLSFLQGCRVLLLQNAQYQNRQPGRTLWCHRKECSPASGPYARRSLGEQPRPHQGFGKKEAKPFRAKYLVSLDHAELLRNMASRKRGNLLPRWRRSLALAP